MQAGGSCGRRCVADGNCLSGQRVLLQPAPAADHGRAFAGGAVSNQSDAYAGAEDSKGVRAGPSGSTHAPCATASNTPASRACAPWLT